MTTRKPLHHVFELGSTEQSKLGSNGPLSQHPVPSLDERANIYLRAVYGSQDLAGEEFARARLRILDAMAEEITQKYRRACALATSGSRHSLQSAFGVFNATISPVWRRIVFVEEYNKAGYRPLTAGIIKHVRKPNE